jgi:hypothetical protein
LKRILEPKKREINGCTMMMSMVIHCIFYKNNILFNFPKFDLMQNFGKKTHFTTIKPFISKILSKKFRNSENSPQKNLKMQ